MGVIVATNGSSFDPTAFRDSLAQWVGIDATRVAVRDFVFNSTAVPPYAHVELSILAPPAGQPSNVSIADAAYRLVDLLSNATTGSAANTSGITPLGRIIGFSMPQFFAASAAAPPPSASEIDDPASGSQLSDGATVGIVVGVVAFAVALAIVLLVVIYRRRRRTAAITPEPSVHGLRNVGRADTASAVRRSPQRQRQSSEHAAESAETGAAFATDSDQTAATRSDAVLVLTSERDVDA